MMMAGDNPMLDVHEVVDLVNHELEYKPDWKIRASVCHWGLNQVDVEVEVQTIDSTDWGRRGMRRDQPLVASFHVEPGPRSAVEDQLMRGLVDIETHEAREFLRFNKHAPFHPHRTDGYDRWTRVEQLPDPV